MRQHDREAEQADRALGYRPALAPYLEAVHVMIANPAGHPFATEQATLDMAAELTRLLGTQTGRMVIRRAGVTLPKATLGGMDIEVDAPRGGMCTVRLADPRNGHVSAEGSFPADYTLADRVAEMRWLP